MEMEEIDKEEKKRLKKEQKEKVRFEKYGMESGMSARYQHAKMRTKERCRESLFALSIGCER